MKLSLAPMLAIAMLVTINASAKPRKPRVPASKVHVCESVDVYFGPVEAGTPSTRISEACKDISIKAAEKKIAACVDAGAETCEVLYSADRTLLIEHKIQAKKEASK